MRVMRFFIIILFVLPTNLVWGGIHPENVRGVIIQNYRKIFDDMFSKQSATCEVGEVAVLKDQDDLKQFFEFYDECGIINTPQFNSLTDDRFYSVSKSDVVFEESNWMREPQALATIYFSDGRIPQIVWFYMDDFESNGRLYHFTDSFKSYISKLTYDIDWENVRHQIKLWEQSKPEGNNIDSIELYTIDDNGNQQVSRSEFVKRIIKHKVNLIRYTDPSLKYPIIEILSKFIVSDVLGYSTKSSGLFYKVLIDGKIEWVTKSSLVRGLIKISYKNEADPELIWITKDGIERDFFKLTHSNSKLDIINVILNEFK